MSEILAIDGKAYPEEADTVEGRLADIMAAPDCVVRVDEYKLSGADRARVVRALRLAAAMAELSGQRS